MCCITVCSVTGAVRYYCAALLFVLLLVCCVTVCSVFDAVHCCALLALRCCELRCIAVSSVAVSCITSVLRYCALCY